MHWQKPQSANLPTAEREHGQIMEERRTRRRFISRQTASKGCLAIRCERRDSQTLNAGRNNNTKIWQTASESGNVLATPHPRECTPGRPTTHPPPSARRVPCRRRHSPAGGRPKVGAARRRFTGAAAHSRPLRCRGGRTWPCARG